MPDPDPGLGLLRCAPGVCAGSQCAPAPREDASCDCAQLLPAGGLDPGPQSPVPSQVLSFRYWWFSLCFLSVS